MGRKVVSAVQLSDIFAARFRDMHPLTRVTGLQIMKDGGGEWMPLGYLGNMGEGASSDAAAILQQMKVEFLLDE